MFTGIIETLGEIVNLETENTNLNIWVKSKITHELTIDQSIAHNGVCLTVVEINQDLYKVTAVKETLQKTNLGKLKNQDLVNLERCMPINGRFDGHIVQGHVDDTATCSKVSDASGSWLYHFVLNDLNQQQLIVNKGSICINGVSLTVVNTFEDGFLVTIIPYTYEHTNFKNIDIGTIVNLEFDIIGKYIQKQLQFKA